MTTDTVRDLADELLGLQSRLDPLNATMLGVPGYDDKLADPSVDAEQILRASALGVEVRAQALAQSVLGPDDAITVAVIAQQARAMLDKIDARMVEYTVTDNNYVGAAATMLTLMPVATLADSEDSDAYLERLRSVPRYLEAVADRHRLGTAAGRRPVRRLVDSAVDHLDRYLADPAADPLLTPATEGPDRHFVAERALLVEKAVRPAMEKYRQVLAEELQPAARSDSKPGLCWLPDGDAAYAALSRVHTTTDRTPDELHQLGLDVIAGLRDEYAEIGSRVFGTANQAEIFHRLATDPAMRWSNSEELLAHARAAVARAEEEMPKWFGILPRQRCEVLPVPPAEAPGAPFAYYFQPSLDGRRPGVYYANTFRAHERDRFLSEVTAFHEAIPGHHLQLTIAIERTELPLLRRLADINATIEGWALYTERLADEMGLYSDDVARLGMLAMDSMRAGRLVVDTGLHAKGWTRDQAIAYLRENAPLSIVEIGREVDRYIAYAAQALSYMTGRLEIQRFRAEAEQRLGALFDIRAFHDLVLRNAPLPVGVLDEVVASWNGGL
jgi:uncharacterized protein (DUF885 family)